MARKKRRRRGQLSEELSEAEILGIEAEDFEDEAPLDEAPARVDRSCLTHPGHDLELACDTCGGAICEVCAVPYHAESLCGDCLSVKILRHQRPGGGWRGFCALALSLVALGALLAPFTLAADPQISADLPGGRTFFAYVAMIGACGGVILGASSQDFEGRARRAGVLGFFFSVFVLLVDSMMKVLSLFV